MRDGQPKAILRNAYQAPDYRIDTVGLHFDLADDYTTVTSALAVRRQDGVAADAPLRLDGQELELLSVKVDGRELSGNEFSQDDDGLTIFTLPAECDVSCVTRTKPELNTALEGLYRSGTMYCTQCEAEGFRKITYYLDRPDVMARFTTTIVADGEQFPTLLSNGNQVDQRILDDGRTSVTWEDPFPKPSYLFALVAGDLAMIEDSFVTMSGRNVVLQIFSEPHNIDKCDYAMDALKRSMAWDEQRFGREYDLDIFMIVAVDDFNMGAMENKGLNVFNTSCVLAHPETTTDAGYQRVEAVVAHEYFHNWSGNRVTCRDWFQLSLKEGFTVFRDAEFSADMASATVKRVEDVSFLRSVQYAEDAGPMAHSIRPDSYIEISNFYTTTIYEKGAEVVRMLQTLLGRDGFRAGSDLYFDRHDGEAATCEDFVLAMEAANDVDLSQFRRWYEYAGTPVVSVSAAATPSADGYSFVVTQSCPSTPGQPDKGAMHIPLVFGLLAADGSQRELAPADVSGIEATPADNGSLILHARKDEHRVTINGAHSSDQLSILRGFSAPVKLQFERELQGLCFLALHDTDGFARWDAAQSLYLAVINQIIAGDSAGQSVVFELVGGLLDASVTAKDDGEEKAMLAAMLSLPSVAYIAEQSEMIDIDGIDSARQQLLTALAERFENQFSGLYGANDGQVDGDQSGAQPEYQPDAASIARRQLRQVALNYLSILERADTVSRLTAQLAAANNMTDRLGALRALVWCPLPAARAPATAALAEFYERFADEALVVDLWFTVQSSNPLPGGVERVRELLEHPAFDPRNPNKQRAVLGGLTQQNPSNFHDRSGAGYDLLADRVLLLDKTNPQMGARLLGPLTRYRRYDAHRQTLMRRALERIATDDQLSKDVFELVSKSLGD